MPDRERNRVNLTYQIALFIYHEARALVAAGFGQDLHGSDLGYPGELEGIPSDTDTYRWADACARFIRYVAQIVSVALQDYQEREVPLLEDITNVFEDDGSI